MTRLAHEAIIQLRAALDYKTYVSSSEQGLCFGITMKWLEACLLGELEEQRYIARIEHIRSDETIAMQIKSVKDKKGNDLTRHDHTLLTILAFYDSLELYQNSSQHISLFNAKVSCTNIDTIAQLAASDALLQCGGLTTFYAEASQYTHDELVDYLTLLGRIMEHHEKPMGMLLLASHHAIGLTYNSHTHQWSLMDINQWPPLVSNNLSAIVEKIQIGFNFNTPYFSLLTKMISSTAALSPNLIHKCETFRKGHLSNIAQKASRASTADWLYLSATEGIVDEVATLLAFMTTHCLEDINKAFAGETPLFIAAAHGHHQVVAILVDVLVAADRVDDLHQTFAEDVTPLYIAAQNGHHQVVTLLVQALVAAERVDALNKIRGDGTTSLYIAAKKGHHQIVRLLVQALVAAERADALSKPRADGTTPLFIAAENGHHQVVALLVEALVAAERVEDLNKARATGATPLYVAAQNGHHQVVTSLVQTLVAAKRVDTLSNPRKDGTTPLFIAAEKGHHQVVVSLIEALVAAERVDDLHKLGADGTTPLFIAAQNGHQQVVTLLVHALVAAGRADALNKVRADGTSPLMIAVRFGHFSVAHFLINFPEVQKPSHLRLHVETLRTVIKQQFSPERQRLVELCIRKKNSWINRAFHDNTTITVTLKEFMQITRPLPMVYAQTQYTLFSPVFRRSLITQEEEHAIEQEIIRLQAKISNYWSFTRKEKALVIKGLHFLLQQCKTETNIFAVLNEVESTHPILRNRKSSPETYDLLLILKQHYNIIASSETSHQSSLCTHQKSTSHVRVYPV